MNTEFTSNQSEELSQGYPASSLDKPNQDKATTEDITQWQLISYSPKNKCASGIIQRNSAYTW
jgi:hypothetical protein